MFSNNLALITRIKLWTLYTKQTQQHINIKNVNNNEVVKQQQNMYDEVLMFANNNNNIHYNCLVLLIVDKYKSLNSIFKI